MKNIKDRIIQNRYLRYLLLISNWVFQGILHADRTEKIYKLAFTLLFSVAIYFILQIGFDISQSWSVLLGILIGHTINWVVNGNIYAILIHRLYICKLNKSDLFDYLDKLIARLDGMDFVFYAASFGSICRGKIKDSSDIDVSIVRKPGFRHSVKALIFITKEKKIADFHGIPLELYLSDSPEDSMNRFKRETNPLRLYDPDNHMDDYYSEIISLDVAKGINGFS